VISDGSFFADGHWHDLAVAMRTPGKGEELVRAYTREGFGGVMRGLSAGIGEDAVDEYWKAFAGDRRRLAQLELYRSGDFEKLEPYQGRLAALGLPALILWGGRDRFAAVKLAHRFHGELAGSELVIIDEAGHFVWEDAAGRATEVLVEVLARRMGG
jgi:haloalkane dehalogenase